MNISRRRFIEMSSCTLGAAFLPTFPAIAAVPDMDSAEVARLFK